MCTTVHWQVLIGAHQRLYKTHVLSCTPFRHLSAPFQRPSNHLTRGAAHRSPQCGAVGTGRQPPIIRDEMCPQDDGSSAEEAALRIAMGV